MQLAYCGTLSFSASGWADSFSSHRFPPSTKSENCFREVLNIWSVHFSGDIYSGTPCVMTLRASAAKLFPTTLANNAAMEQHKHRCENESSDFNLFLICKITFCTRFISTGKTNKETNLWCPWLQCRGEDELRCWFAVLDWMRKVGAA